MNPKTARGALLLVISAALLFGVNAGASRIVVEAGLPISTFTTVRVTGAFLAFALIAAAFDRSAFKMPVGRNLVLVIALGVVGVAFLQWTYNFAIVRLPIGIALLLEYLAPVLVVIWVRFFRREAVHPRVWPAIGLALIGLAMVGQVWAGLTIDGIGLIVALISSVCFASYFLIGEELTASANPLTPLRTVLWSFGIATVTMNVLGGWTDVSEITTSASMLGRLAEFTIPAWAAMAWVILLGTVTPFFLYLAALRALSSAKASVTAMLEPVVAVGVGWLWFYEAMTPIQLAGVTAVIAGIIVAQTARVAHPDELPPAV